MPEAPLLGASRKVKLDDGAFGERFRGPLVHQSVRAEQAARRRGTAATKTRGMVRGGGAKPWRQKGTGRARAGSTRSPLWAGGGTVFGPRPRSYTLKVNRKEQRAALRSALSLHAERGSIAVLDAASFKQPRTRQARELLEDWGEPAPTLVVLAAEESAAALSFRNLARVAVLAAEHVGVADLLGAASLVVSEPALESLTSRAGSPEAGGRSAPAAEAKAAARVPRASRSRAKAGGEQAKAGGEAAGRSGEQAKAGEAAKGSDGGGESDA
jgi:large subunit ribosomal protein L4